MSIRSDRQAYFIKLSKKLGDGYVYFEPWHRWASYRKQREDKYKNIDRTTIRKI